MGGVCLCQVGGKGLALVSRWVGICLCQVGEKGLALVSRWVGFVSVKWVRRGWPWSLGGWGLSVSSG